MLLPHHAFASRIPLHPTARAVRAALLLLLGASAAALAIAPASARAAETAPAAAVRNYQIAAGDLQTALASYAVAAGINVSTQSTPLAGLRSKGVQGRHAPLQGLQKILEGSGMEATDSGNGNYLVRKAMEVNVATMPAVTISAEADRNTEGTGSYTTKNMSTATGLTLSQRQTPQSVSVISRQQMDDFNLTTLQEVALATPGIYTKQPGVTDQETSYFARGFALTHVNVDGLPLDVTGFNQRNVSADMIMYDRVEVVRGATGLMEGAGAPSGSINLVRKRPTSTPLLNGSVALGSWRDKQVTFDAGAALNDSGSLRGRVAGSWRDSDSFVDVVKHRNGTVYGIVEADLGPATTLGLGFHARARAPTASLSACRPCPAAAT